MGCRQLNHQMLFCPAISLALPLSFWGFLCPGPAHVRLLPLPGAGFLIIISQVLFVINCETLSPKPKITYLMPTYLCWSAGVLMLSTGEGRLSTGKELEPGDWVGQAIRVGQLRGPLSNLAFPPSRSSQLLEPIGHVQQKKVAHRAPAEFSPVGLNADELQARIQSGCSGPTISHNRLYLVPSILGILRRLLEAPNLHGHW